MGIFGADVAVSLVDDAFILGAQDSADTIALPAYVAVQAGTTRVLACGEEAKSMVGREPASITAVRILEEGRIAKPNFAESLFRFGLVKLLGRSLLKRPRVLVATRSGDSGKREVVEMAKLGGAREVHLMEMAMATAIGMQVEVQKPEVQAVLSLSDDWFEFAVIALAGELVAVNGSIGVRHFVEDIQNHCTMCHQFRPETAPLTAQLMTEGVNPGAAVHVPGWETWSGRTEQGRLASHAITRDGMMLGMMPSLVRLTERIKGSIRGLPHEKQYPLSRATIHAAGSAFAIPGLAQAIAGQLGQSVTPHAGGIHPSIECCRTVLTELKDIAKIKRAGL